MATVLVLFAHPRALSRAEARDWAGQQGRELPGVRSSRVVPLGGLEGLPSPYDWMLELDLEPDSAFDGCRDLMLDLRLLGTRPQAVVLS